MIPEFKTKEELYKYLRENKNLLITQKKSVIKHGDAVCAVDFELDDKAEIYTPKAYAATTPTDYTKLKAKLVINTTNLMDSHSDVHIPGLWKKNLQESKDKYLLKEHQLRFENIISDDIKAFTQKMTWKDLGYKFEGETEALIFDTEIEKDRNEYMAEQYAKGRVKQHSVGMIYVKLFLCINSESKFDKEEKANWDKYFPLVANKEKAEEQGYFWAVTEAKCIEGSAVPLGSNYATPTISIEPVGTTQSTNEEPEEPTKSLDCGKIAEAIKASIN